MSDDDELATIEKMQRNERWPDDDPDSPVRSRQGSRRNSASSRRNSLQKEKETKKRSPLNSTVDSCNSTPRRVQKPPSVDLMVTGRQILKRSDRANSLPGSSRRPSTEAPSARKRPVASPKHTTISHSSRSGENSLEDDMTLDLSQVSDFEDLNSKYGMRHKFAALATSTPKNFQKTRSGSVQSQLSKAEPPKRSHKSFDSKQSRESTFSYSRDSLYTTSSSRAFRQGVSTELDYSSVSPEYSGQSSAEASPRSRPPDLGASPRSQDLTTSCCVSTCQGCSEAQAERPEAGEWNHFWANYNNSVSKVPVKSYYDQCPTPYRTDNIDLADFEFPTEQMRKRTPDNFKNINTIIRNEGLHLTPRETQNIIKCAHILGNVLTKAIERRSQEKEENSTQELIQKIEADVEIMKQSMTLDLKETALPVDVKEEKRCETVTTQTDISLPNTKSAPRIFEKILRQLSKSSLEDSAEAKEARAAAKDEAKKDDEVKTDE